MRLKTLAIKNLRVLEDINITFDARVNVIVGPNAIGKTTILEAIRLAKAMLAPRTGNEAQQSLIALSAMSPHMPQRLRIDAIARDNKIPVEIKCGYELSPEELAWLESAIPRTAMNLVQTRMGQGFANPAALVSFLSTEQGAHALDLARTDLTKAIETVRTRSNICRLDLTLEPTSGQFRSGHPVMPALIGALDQRNPPNRTIFSYFPADRALPQGEQPIQLGGPDSATQLESHSSQPQLKYARLKNTIFNTLLVSTTDRDQLREEFTRIFNGILKGRELGEVGIDEIGLVSIKVKDTESGRIFDIDGMSSGEKGLILTFLLIARSITEGGVILIDEPELHLNPAVCKDLLAFLIEQYAVRMKLQAIICSHSPEILAGAFESDECALYHLESSTMLTKVRIQDQDTIAEALRRLGTSVSDGLLYLGTIFVEGPDDVTTLEAGFGEMLRRYKLRDLGGRREVEKQIRLLQEMEKRGAKHPPRYFIFDHDEAPTRLVSSEYVKVLQWDRRCLENYLLDLDVLTDLLKDPDIVKQPLSSQGEVLKLLTSLAMTQLDDFVGITVFKEYGYQNPRVKADEIQGKSSEEIAEILAKQLLSVQSQLAGFDEATWKSEFLHKFAAKRKELESVWEQKWRQNCDGKRLFLDLRSKVTLNIALPQFKRRIVLQMKSARLENWLLIESRLKGLVAQ